MEPPLGLRPGGPNYAPTYIALLISNYFEKNCVQCNLKREYRYGGVEPPLGPRLGDPNYAHTYIAPFIFFNKNVKESISTVGWGLLWDCVWAAQIISVTIKIFCFF